MKIIFPIALTLAITLGYAIGVKNTEKLAVSAPVILSQPDHSAEIQNLIDHEYTDYLRLKSLEEKYKKADEILGKIMNIFLADLSLHFKPEVKAAITATEPATAPTSLPSAKVSKNENQAPLSTRPGQITRVSQIDTPAQIGRFLKSVQTDQFKKLLSHSSLIKKEPENLNGCFDGAGTVTDPNETWWIVMNHRFDQGANGENLIVISRDGKVFSRAKGNGSNQHLRGIPESPEAILLEAAPDLMFQMYFIATSQQWIGNIYQKSKTGAYRTSGTFDLKRGSNCGEYVY